jgi:hypothetical protein
LSSFAAIFISVAPSGSAAGMGNATSPHPALAQHLQSASSAGTQPTHKSHAESWLWSDPQKKTQGSIGSHLGGQINGPASSFCLVVPNRLHKLSVGASAERAGSRPKTAILSLHPSITSTDTNLARTSLFRRGHPPLHPTEQLLGRRARDITSSFLPNTLPRSRLLAAA